jgi:hypothetical protein
MNFLLLNATTSTITTLYEKCYISAIISTLNDRNMEKKALVIMKYDLEHSHPLGKEEQITEACRS